MTADERIEALLNRFGQTISDLPKPDKGKFAYLAPHRGFVEIAVNEWCRHDVDLMLLIDKYRDYICHLADVIDRMEVALETAKRTGLCCICYHKSREIWGCQTCKEAESNYVIADDFLRDIGDGDDANNDNQRGNRCRGGTCQLGLDE